MNVVVTVRPSDPMMQPSHGAPYRIVRELAAGGMASVFLAEHDAGDGVRQVAVKRLHPHLAGEEDFVTMFFDEAQLASRIRHPNVVRVLEVVQTEGLAIVMEYVKGPTVLELARELHRSGGRIAREITARIALDTLAGLHAAHELKDPSGEPLALVHRDVSPHNILVGVDGVSRLTDFGISKAAVRLAVTRAGQTKGKLAYMAPEQFLGEDCDRRTDLFTMGIVLWELFSGHRLFGGSSEATVVHALLYKDLPRMRSVDPTLPESLDDVVMRALRRDPAERWPSAEELSRALEAEVTPAPHEAVGALASTVLDALSVHRSQRPAPTSSAVRVVPQDREAFEVTEVSSDDEPTLMILDPDEPEPPSSEPARAPSERPVAQSSAPSEPPSTYEPLVAAPAPFAPSPGEGTLRPPSPVRRGRAAVLAVGALLALLVPSVALWRSSGAAHSTNASRSLPRPALPPSPAPRGEPLRPVEPAPLPAPSPPPSAVVETAPPTPPATASRANPRLRGGRRAPPRAGSLSRTRDGRLIIR